MAAPFIIHVATSQTWRGGEQQVLYLVQGLAELGVRQMVFAARGGVLARRAARECTVVEFTSDASMSIQWAKGIKHACKGQYLAIVHAHDSHAHNHAVLSRLMACPAPIIVSRRVQRAISTSTLSHWKYNNRSVRRILCVSNAVRTITEPAIVNKAVLATVYDGIRLDRFSAKRTGILQSTLGIPPELPVVGYVAALTREKDHATFVRTVANLKATGLNASFVLIGEGPERPMIERMISEANLNDVIRLLGHRTDVPLLLPDLDVVLCTTAREGLGTSLLDAMACGIPVVTTNAGGIPEIVTDGYNGLIAAVGDHTSLARGVRALLESAELRASIASHGRDVAKQFTSTRMAHETYEHYQRVLLEPQ